MLVLYIFVFPSFSISSDIIISYLKKYVFGFFLLINVCYYCLIFLSVLDYIVLIFKYICKTSNLAENPLTTIQDITYLMWMIHIRNYVGQKLSLKKLIGDTNIQQIEIEKIISRLTFIYFGEFVAAGRMRCVFPHVLFPSSHKRSTMFFHLAAQTPTLINFWGG